MSSLAPPLRGKLYLRHRTVAATSLLLWVGLAGCYARRPDAAAAVTLFPAWLWVLPGLVLALLAGWRWRGARFLVGSWVLFLLLFAEEPRSLLRSVSVAPARRGDADRLRVVSLNCAGGSPEAAAEAAACDPDLVLLQEVPAERDVRKLARRLFGPNAGMVYGYDTAILAREPLAESVPAQAQSFFVAGRTQLKGRPVEVVSLRLTPPVVRMDLWSPDCWREQTANRRARREQMGALRAYLDRVPPEIPLVVGGDFNAPGGDAIFKLLAPRLHDSFAVAGLGWGNTGLNDLPVSRVDQVWADRHWRARTVVARRTRHSDHRMVVADLRPSAGG